MNKKELDGIIDRLIENAKGVMFGSATLTIRLHDGRATETTISITQNAKQKMEAHE
jgi:hypothetical protein